MNIVDANGVPIDYLPMTFPDGQRHINIDNVPAGGEVTIKASITNPDVLFDVLLAADILKDNGNLVHLYVEYLMGGRMDRQIDSHSPFTLKVVADILRTADFTTITVLDPHSRESTRLLGAAHDYPFARVLELLDNYDPVTTVIIAPDAGSVYRVEALVPLGQFKIVYCLKERDAKTGKLSGFRVTGDPHAVLGKGCLILDDICDGGGTFSGLAAVLLALGAKWVDLFVTHGIFSNGRELDGIRNIYSTNSYRELG